MLSGGLARVYNPVYTKNNFGLLQLVSSEPTGNRYIAFKPNLFCFLSLHTLFSFLTKSRKINILPCHRTWIAKGKFMPRPGRNRRTYCFSSPCSSNSDRLACCSGRVPIPNHYAGEDLWKISLTCFNF